MKEFKIRLMEWIPEAEGTAHFGVSKDGVREGLGLWIAVGEGAKFWLSAMTALKIRDVQAVRIAGS